MSTLNQTKTIPLESFHSPIESEKVVHNFSLLASNCFDVECRLICQAAILVQFFFTSVIINYHQEWILNKFTLTDVSNTVCTPARRIGMLTENML